MTTPRRTVIARFFLAGLSLLIAVATGIDWIGRPFRAVELLTLVGLGALAGVSWMQAVAGAREHNRERLQKPAE